MTTAFDDQFNKETVTKEEAINDLASASFQTIVDQFAGQNSTRFCGHTITWGEVMIQYEEK